MAPKTMRCLILGFAVLLGIAGCVPATDEGPAAATTGAGTATVLAPMATLSPDASVELLPATAGAAAPTIEDGGQVAPDGSIDLRELPPPPDSAAADGLIELPAPGVPDPLAQAVQLARQDLGVRLLGLALRTEDAEEMVLVSFEETVWSDRSLGCPKPDTEYVDEETPGFKILLAVGDERYTYHTDLGRNVVLCLEGEPAPPLEG